MNVDSSDFTLIYWWQQFWCYKEWTHPGQSPRLQCLESAPKVLGISLWNRSINIMQNRVKVFLNPVVRNWLYKGRYVYDFHPSYFFTWACCLESVLILSPSLSCVYPEEKQTHFSSGRAGSGHIRAAGPAAKLWWSFVANSAGGSRGDHPVLKK